MKTKMEPPAGDVPKTIYSYMSKAKNKYANVTAYERTRERTQDKQGGTSFRGKRYENILHKSGKKFRHAKTVKTQREIPKNEKMKQRENPVGNMKKKKRINKNASAAVAWC